MDTKTTSTDLTERDEKMVFLTKEFMQMRKYYVDHGVSDEAVRSILSKHIRLPKLSKEQGSQSGYFNSRKMLCLIFLPCMAAVLLGPLIIRPQFFGEWNLIEMIYDSECLIDQNLVSLELTRPLFDCSVCENLKAMPIVHKISKQEFEQKYAYSGVPVLVKSATENWTAMDTFNFKYFKTLYHTNQESLRIVDEECQFFPYKTEFETLTEALSMPDSRAQYHKGEMPWYIGWSNCDQTVRDELRQHYQRPYFLPEDSESSILDWIFMGGPGPGAYIHIDNVNRPSWQAQITGSKTWNLFPAPECEASCTNLNVTMTPGDIIVVDTNQWYHSTFIHDGELSITIGSEYD